MIVLVDLDGVVADFERGFLDEWNRRHPETPGIPLESRTTFHVRDQYAPALRADVEAIYQAAGFYQSLPLVQGAKEALSEMHSMGFEVFICTAPLKQYRNCVLEKYEWVEEMLGGEWVSRIIMTKHKHRVLGDGLIDDNPDPLGKDQSAKPTWTHVMFDQPYNRAVNSSHRITWRTWKSLPMFSVQG